MSLRATSLLPEEGEIISGMGVTIRFLADSAANEGRYGSLVYTVPAGMSGPPLHRHAFDEHFFVLDGILTFAANGELFEGGPGTSVFVPGGVPHTFANKSDAPATYLLTFTPGGFENFFKEAAAAIHTAQASEIPSILGELQVKYGVESVGPPI